MAVFEQNTLANLLWSGNIEGEYNDEEFDLDVESFEAIMNSSNITFYLEYVNEYNEVMFNHYIKNYKKHPKFIEYIDKFIDNYPNYSQVDNDGFTFLMEVVYYSENFDNFMEIFHKVLSKTPQDVIYEKNCFDKNILNYACCNIEQELINLLLTDYDFDIITNNEYSKNLYHVSLLSDICHDSNKPAQRIELLKEFIEKGCPIKKYDMYFYHSLNKSFLRTDYNGEFSTEGIDFIFDILDMLIDIKFFEHNHDNFIDIVFGKIYKDDMIIFNYIPKEKFEPYIDYFISLGYQFENIYPYMIYYDIDLFKKVIEYTPEEIFYDQSNKFLSIYKPEHIEYLKYIIENYDINYFSNFNLLFKSFGNDEIKMILEKMISKDIFLDNNILEYFFRRCNSDSFKYVVTNANMNIEMKLYDSILCQIDIESLQLFLERTTEINYPKLLKFIVKKGFDLDDHNIFSLINDNIEKIDKKHINLVLFDYYDQLNEDIIVDYIEKYHIKNIGDIYVRSIVNNRINIIKVIREKYPYVKKYKLSILKLYDPYDIEITKDNYYYFYELISNTPKDKMEKIIVIDGVKELIHKVCKEDRMNHVMLRYYMRTPTREYYENLRKNTKNKN